MPGPLERVTLSDRAADALIDLIQERGLRDGDPIPATSELSEQLNVSRPVVREAVATLAGQGLLVRQQGREATVTAPGSVHLERLLRLRFAVAGVDLADVQEFRESIEVSAARLAARNATEADVAALSKAMNRLRSVRGDEELHDADVAFHHTVATAAGNDLIQITIEALSPLLRQLRTRVWAGWVAKGHGLQEIIEAHQLVLDRIAAADQDGAAEAMRRHLGQARSGLDPT